LPGAFLVVKGGWHIRLTTLPLPVNQVFKNACALTSHNPLGLHGKILIFLTIQISSTLLNRLLHFCVMYAHISQLLFKEGADYL
jgi:hypothetical protein